MPQTGVSLEEHEIKDLIKNHVAELTGKHPDELHTYVTCWNGRLSTVTVHMESSRDISLIKVAE